MQRFAQVLIALVVGSLAATIPYQGLATDTAGLPVPDKEHEFTFTLTADSSSTKELWTEKRQVSTRKGLFSVELGSEVPIPEKVLRSGDPFLSVSLDGEAIKTRLRLGRVPRAHHATASDTASFASRVAGLEALLARVAAIESANAALAVRRVQDSSRIERLEQLLRGVSRTGQEIAFDSVNLTVRNGLGRTDSVNGLGNLTIGYNELRGDSTDRRTGSHMLVVGKGNSYSSAGGIVVGYWNLTSGLYSSVSGGSNNSSTGYATSVSGGSSNRSSGLWGSVVGGTMNHAQGRTSTVVGGSENRATAYLSAVFGGGHNQAAGQNATVTGGMINYASGEGATVSGGSENVASGTTAAVGGGTGNTVTTVNGFAP